MLRCLRQICICSLLRSYPRCIAHNLTNSLLVRKLSDSNGDDHCKGPIFLTGGLGKFQGCFKEETYFQNENYKLIIKMKERQKGNNIEDEPKKIPQNADLSAAKLLKTRPLVCAPSKHKNFPEEIFFFNEQMECSKALCKRFKNVTDKTENLPNEERIIEDDVNEDEEKAMTTLTGTVTSTA